MAGEKTQQQRPRRAATLIVLLLALLLGLQPVTTDLYLPALPALSAGFGADMVQTQLTLTALLLSFGVSQLVWGPVSDRWGRRPVLLWGMFVYGLASLACSLAPSMFTLILARAIQGLAMGAGVMAARAIVRDLYEPTEGAKVMSQALTGLGMIACTCAPVGGLLTDWLGWRWALSSLMLYGAVTWALIYYFFDETLAQPNPKALQTKTLLAASQKILKHHTFQAYSALSSASFAGLFTFLATSSFVFIQEMGLSKTHYGLLMLSMSLSYIVGTFICRRLLRHFRVQQCVMMASIVSVSAGVLLTVLTYSGAAQSGYAPWAIMVPINLFLLAHGVHQPCGQSGSIAPFPEMAGTASALNGFLMMVVAFGVGSWLGTHMTSPVFSLAHGVLLWSACIALIAWTRVRQIPISTH
ncbi:MAG: Bcr/CflA family efflux MFS transporter [Betaproteobacteria bacterium]|nr:Bcr/CflA family efflux MFS transporter [Betaproteobacteria bacterium]NBX91414.1 Bcr/CflA family efflux MFS transporter [Betaproteobacteria bacterium]